MLPVVYVVVALLMSPNGLEVGGTPFVFPSFEACEEVRKELDSKAKDAGLHIVESKCFAMGGQKT